MSPNNEWQNDFNEFMSSGHAKVPEVVSAKVLVKMDSLLNPSAKAVFAKILGIHLVVGFLSLAVCHQFGMNPFGTSFSLESVFMKMGGHSVCMVFCGVLFVGLSFLTAGAFLSIEEIRALKRTEFAQVLSLGVISLGLFSVVGAELALTFAGFWLLGALIGGWISIEGSLWFRKHRNFAA
jgi:hypothetical protein